MAEVKYGQLDSWDDADTSTPNDFMRLVEGDNQVRVIAKPFQFYAHWVQDPSGANRKIRCADKARGCPLCKKAVKAQPRWFLAVLDRKSGLPKILEVSKQIYDGIKKYVNNREWNDGKFYQHSWSDKVMSYDVNIQRGPKGTNPLYTVMGVPKFRDLNDEEKAIAVNFFERVDINKFCQPPTSAEVAEKMGVVDDSPAPSYAVGTKTVVKGSDGKVTVKDEDFDFGDEQL